MKLEKPELLEAAISIAKEAGRVILQHYGREIEVTEKSDSSPITEADLSADRAIRTGLEALHGGIPIVSEEAESGAVVFSKPFWLVDPLDGTKEFINRNGEFTVNIALIEDRQPVLGVVFAPALNLLYAGGVGIGAFEESDGARMPLRCRRPLDCGLSLVASRSHGDAEALMKFMAGERISGVQYRGSSLKLCLVAAGKADIYPRLGRTMEWDIAAGHAVIRAAGGSLTDLLGSELEYGKPGLENPHFVARGLPPARRKSDG